ncbi:hypothetical protein EON63_22725 [archaeon]|nr:MAG: hypothetical protein EON63_22725 [archaeon]
MNFIYRLAFEDLFNHRIQQLLFNFPLDRRTSNGTPFWSGGKLFRMCMYMWYATTTH